MKTSKIMFSVLFTTKLAHAFFIDPRYKIADWDGWGTRISYWSNVVGGFNEEVQTEIVNAIFSPDFLNTNIVRYTIGATTPGDRSCGNFNSGADAESFQDGIDAPFLETRDPRARKILLAAKAAGADTFEAFSFSPPSWMTRSNCSKGNPDGAPLHDNFDPKYANAFANYMTNVVKYYHEKHNVSFSYLCPFYEPSSGSFRGPESGIEGCNMEPSTIIEVIRSTHVALLAKKLTFCSISVAHEVSANAELITQKLLVSMGLDKLYKKVGFLGGIDGGLKKQAELFTLASKSGIKIETKNDWASQTRLPNMTQGEEIASKIINSIRVVGVSSWGFQEAVPDFLIQIPYSDPKVENIKYTSGYYTLMQFSKYIRKGYTIVHVSDENSVAAHSSSCNTLVIVTVNSGSSSTIKSIDLSAFEDLGQIFSFRTSPYEPHVPVLPPTLDVRLLHVELPANSVTTIQILNAVPFQRNNLVRNGNFESGSEMDAWFLMYGERSDKGINGDYTYRGNFSGNIDYSESKLTLMQNITIKVSTVHHLSARCSASGNGVTFGALVNGYQTSEITVAANLGYRLYGLTINANEGDVISVYLHSESGNHTAQIDDVVMH